MKIENEELNKKVQEQKIKYIFFGYVDYMEIALKDILHQDNVIYYHYNPKNIWKKIVNRIIFKNNVFNFIPSFLYKDFYNTNWIKKDEIPVFIFYEQNFMSCNKPFISHLRKKYPLSKIIFIFTNICKNNINKVQLDFVLANRKLYDLIISFNEPDVEKYNFTFYDQIFSKIDFEESPENKSDISFYGLDKGRYEFLKQIFIKLTKQNIKCDFNIYDFNGVIDFKASGFNVYREKETYMNILMKELNSNCLLEVLADVSQPGCSIRVAETIANKKKLLTNNVFIKNKEYYNPKQLSVFTSVEDIDIDFIKKNIQPDELIDSSIVSPQRFLSFLEKWRVGN